MIKDIFQKWWKEEFKRQENLGIRASKLRYYDSNLFSRGNPYHNFREKERSSSDVVSVVSDLERAVKEIKEELEKTYQEVEAMKDFLNVHYVPKHKDCVDVPAKMVKSNERKASFYR